MKVLGLAPQKWKLSKKSRNSFRVQRFKVHLVKFSEGNPINRVNL